MQRIKQTMALTVFILSYIAFGYVMLNIGRAQFHNEIIEDMKRYNEPPLLGRRSDGSVYLITVSDKPTGRRY